MINGDEIFANFTPKMQFLLTVRRMVRFLSVKRHYPELSSPRSKSVSLIKFSPNLLKEIQKKCTGKIVAIETDRILSVKIAG